MKKPIAILILCSLLFQCVAHFSVLALFELRRDYIAKNLCENRDKPELKCCGKCYLKKQLGKVDESDNGSKNTPQKVEKQEIVVYVIPAPANFALVYVAWTEQRFNPGSQKMNDYDPAFSVFRPPTFLG